jgi:lipid A 4'-phosphatase
LSTNFNASGAPLSRQAAFTNPIVLSLAFTVIASAFFYLFPQLDIATSDLFYRMGGGFPYAAEPAPNALRVFARWIPWVLVAFASLSIVLEAIGAKRPRHLSLRGAIFVLAPYALGVGILVNVVLKNHWGRPRPIQVDLFGGDASYVPVWQISNYCETNCSFVSGEASTAIWFVSLAFVVPPSWRRVTLVTLLVFAATLSVNRIAFGAHFLSDIIIAWGLMALVISTCHQILLGHRS